jgi:flagellar biosynthesis/type III secretory pathway protein FliH
MNTKKDTTIKIRISTRDKEIVQDQAKRELSTLSNYVRTKIIKDERVT